jgi:hypothetical protein
MCAMDNAPSTFNQSQEYPLILGKENNYDVTFCLEEVEFAHT